MTAFTRLTLVGSAHRADVVVPSTEALGAMVPDLLELLREEVADVPQSVALVRVTGEQIDLGIDCVSQDVADGEVLRLVRTSDAPPPPQVADVTDSAAEHLDVRADRWSLRTRQTLATVVVGLAAAVAGLIPLLGAAPADSQQRLWIYAGTLLLAVGASAAVGRTGRRYVGGLLAAAAAGLVLPLTLAALPVLAASDALRVGVVALWIVLGAGVGIGRSSRGALTGAAAGIVLTLLGLALDHLLPAIPAGAVMAAVTALAAGLLPWYAMVTSGLTGLDDQALDGDAPATHRVDRTLDDAYAVLTWATVAVALTSAWATVGLLTAGDTSALVLGLLTIAVLALRTRSVPLRAQVVVLWAAVLVPLTVLLLGPVASHDTTLAAALTGAAGLLVAVVAALTPSGRQRARLRRLGDLAELFAVLGILPILLGLLGVYGMLLETF